MGLLGNRRSRLSRAGESEHAPVAEMSPFSSQGFRWFFAGRVVSLLGTSMASVALAFAVLDVSDNAADLGFVLAANSIPFVLFILVGGAVSDRVSRSAVLLVSNLGAGLTQAVVSYLLISGSFNLTLILPLEFVNGALAAFTMPAQRGLVPQVVRRAQLQRANSLLASSGSAISIAGPTAAGIVSATIGGGWAVAFDAASFLAAAVCMSRLRLPSVATDAVSTMLHDLRTGWTAFRRTTWIWAVVSVSCAANFIYAGVWMTLGPVIALDTIGAASWGIVLSASSMGLLIGGAVMYRVHIVSLLAVGQVGAAAMAVPMIALGLHSNTVTLAAAALMAGMGIQVFGIAWDTSLQEHVPNDILSRVASYDDLGSFVAIPLGQVVVGPLAVAYGSTDVALVGGLLYATLVIAVLAVPAVRNLRHAPPSVEAAA